MHVCTEYASFVRPARYAGNMRSFSSLSPPFAGTAFLVDAATPRGRQALKACEA